MHKASDYSQPLDYVRNQQADTKYCNVPPGSIGTYEANGWKLSLANETPTRPSRGKVNPDGTMGTLGCLLMEMPLEQWNDMNLNGVSGRGGQVKIDRIEARMNLKGGLDPVRGMHGDTFTVTDESEAKETQIARATA
jgi:hypothetical protein